MPGLSGAGRRGPGRRGPWCRSGGADEGPFLRGSVADIEGAGDFDDSGRRGVEDVDGAAGVDDLNGVAVIRDVVRYFLTTERQTAQKSRMSTIPKGAG